MAVSLSGSTQALTQMRYPVSFSSTLSPRGSRTAETPALWAVQRKLVENDVPENLVLYPAQPFKGIDVDCSFNQIRASPAIHPLPLVVLSATLGPSTSINDRGWEATGDIPPDFGYITDSAQKTAREYLARFVPNAKHITNTSSGHEIHKEQALLAAHSIRDVVEAVRSGNRQIAR